jgi:hypothetical protein
MNSTTLRTLVGPGFALGLLVGCSGGSDSQVPPIRVSFASASSQVDEGDIATDVFVVLHTELAGIPNDVTVTFEDAGSGTALSGVDFEALPEQVITFPAGSVDGDSVRVDVQSIDDSQAEAGSETVQLRLTTPTGGVALVSPKTHALSIVDDERVRASFASDTAVAPDEATLGTVDVVLELDPGVTLAAALDVDVRDTLDGTATPLLDYVFGNQTLTFPAGSPGGTTLTLPIVGVDDLLVEGAETIVLEIVPISTTVELGTFPIHTLTITDDEAGLGSQLTLSLDPGGLALPLASGSTIASGSAALGTTVDTTVRWASVGSTDVSIEVPLVTGTNVRDFELEFAAAPTSMPEAAAMLPSPLSRVGSALHLDPELLAASEALSRVRWLAFPSLRGPQVVEARRLRSPWAANALFVVDGEAREKPAVLPSLWRGTLAGDPGSSVFVAFAEGTVSGWLQHSDGSTEHLLSAREGTELRVVLCDDSTLAARGARAPLEFCEEPVRAVGQGAPRAVTAPEGATMPAGTWPVAQLALETDFQLYQVFGSSLALTNYVTSLVAAVSARYQMDIGTELEIAYLGIHTTAADGWTTPDGPGSTNAMLDEFQQAWAPGLGGTPPVSANLYHFLSGASLGGGIAYIGVLCDANWGFGVSGNLNGAINWGTWSGASGPLTWDFVVFAHELGHNFGSQHTHSYCPPLDRCYTNCGGTTACTLGTLMSYCHLCGGMSNIALRFHGFTANEMRSQVTNSCLGEILLQSATSVDCTFRFRPSSGTGAKSAEVDLDHGATNQPVPFQLNLTGTALP